MRFIWLICALSVAAGASVALQAQEGEADLTNPDFPALARAFGARGERVADIDALGGALTTALAADGPTVLELKMPVDPPWEL